MAVTSRAIAIVTPAPRGSRTGNRVTALRWAGLLRQLGWRPFVCTEWAGQPARAMLAVHARKSAPSIAAFAAAQPHLPIAVLLAGTDIYPTVGEDPALHRSLGLAHVLIALQSQAAAALPAQWRGKVRVVPQSATAPPPGPKATTFQACVLAHLRQVKDPLLAAAAVRLLPPDVPCRVVLAGGVLEAPFAAAATAARSDRFAWIGEQSRSRARALLRTSHLCLVTSRDEGGANVISEAIAAGTPVLATAVPGNTGILGHDWPGLFPPGDAHALAALLVRAATDADFMTELQHRTEQLQGMVSPARERAALAALMAELGVRAE